MGQSNSEETSTVVQASDGGRAKDRKAKKRAQPAVIKNAVEVVAVKILDRDGESVLVEYQTQRRYVPAKKLSGNDIELVELERGVRYGEDWTKWDDGPGADAFAAQLYASRIYTKSDLLRNSGEVRAALQRLYVNPVVSEMLKKAAGK